jgi:hypothetical protein
MDVIVLSHGFDGVFNARPQMKLWKAIGVPTEYGGLPFGFDEVIVPTAPYP